MTDFDTVKKELLSILNMYPRGIAIDKLKKEYKENVGTHIPHGKFGYQSIINLLKDELKQNVSVEMVGPEWVCIPLGSKNTQHILDMNKNQNPAKNKKQNGVNYIKK